MEIAIHKFKAILDRIRPFMCLTFVKLNFLDIVRTHMLLNTFYISQFF